MENDQHLILFIKNTEEELFIKLGVGGEEGRGGGKMVLESKVHICRSTYKKIYACFLHNSVLNFYSPKTGGKLHLKVCNQHKIQFSLEVTGVSLDT